MSATPATVLKIYVESNAVARRDSEPTSGVGFILCSVTATITTTRWWCGCRGTAWRVASENTFCSNLSSTWCSPSAWRGRLAASLTWTPTCTPFVLIAPRRILASPHSLKTSAIMKWRRSPPSKTRRARSSSMTSLRLSLTLSKALSTALRYVTTTTTASTILRHRRIRRNLSRSRVATLRRKSAWTPPLTRLGYSLGRSALNIAPKSRCRRPSIAASTRAHLIAHGLSRDLSVALTSLPALWAAWRRRSPTRPRLRVTSQSLSSVKTFSTSHWLIILSKGSCSSSSTTCWCV